MSDAISPLNSAIDLRNSVHELADMVNEEKTEAGRKKGTQGTKGQKRQKREDKERIEKRR